MNAPMEPKKSPEVKSWVRRLGCGEETDNRMAHGMHGIRFKQNPVLPSSRAAGRLTRQLEGCGIFGSGPRR